ncbi:MAG: hypothetical protein GY679_00915, partial [Mycoplasma sp.]|nr:hypothetical protein [Mycoplasma sp.]
MKKYKAKKITFISAFVIVTIPVVTVVSCNLIKKDKKNIKSIIHGKSNTKTHGKSNTKIDKPTKSIVKSKLHIMGKNGIGIYNMPSFNGADVTLVSGNKSGHLSNGDVLIFKFTLKNGFVWSDGSRGAHSVSIEVDGLGKADTKINVPTKRTVKSMLNISGHNRSGTYNMPSFNGADVTLVSGNKSGHLSNGDVLIFKFTLKNGFVWSDGSRGAHSVSIEVDGLKTDNQIAKPTENSIKSLLNISGKNGAGIYDMPTIEGVNVRLVSGKASGSLRNDDELVFGFSLKPGYVWSDGGRGEVRITIMVAGLMKKEIEIEKIRKYDLYRKLQIGGEDGSGTYRIPTFKGVNLRLVSGKSSGSLRNDDILVFALSLKPGYVWNAFNDDSHEEIRITIKVAGLMSPDTIIAKPIEGLVKVLLSIHGNNGTGTYDMPRIVGADVRLISGNKSGHLSNGDVLIFGFSLKRGYVWSDDSHGEVRITIKVAGLNKSEIRVEKPTENSVRTLLNIHGNNGSGIYNMPIINGTTVTLGSGSKTGSLRNGDTLTFIYNLKSGYVWSDGSRGAKTVSIKINELKEKSSVDPNKIALKGNLNGALFSVGFKGYNGKGRIQKPSNLNGMLNFLHVSMRIEGKTENLSNGDIVKFIFTPISGYTWGDGTRTPVTLSKKVTGLSSKPKGQTHTNFVPFADFTMNSTARNSAGSYIRNNLKNFIAGFVIMDNYGNVAMKDWAGDTLGNVSSIGSSGINVGISFGGAHGTSPSVYAASNGRSADWLYNQYVNTIERIDNIKYVDWDVEGLAARNSRASRLRSEAIKRLRTRYPKLKLSVTVATATYGVMDNVWNNVVKPLKGSINNVNIMAMDYGGPMSESSMLNAAKSAATATANRLAREGWVDQNNKYSMVGLIPMIGKNDIASEIFTLNSARKIAEWAVKVHLGTLSMWSITRDENGGDPALNTHIGTSSFAFANAMKVV